jgi:hypothetical protein
MLKRYILIYKITVGDEHSTLRLLLRVQRKGSRTVEALRGNNMIILINAAEGLVRRSPTNGV